MADLKFTGGSDTQPPADQDAADIEAWLSAPAGRAPLLQSMPHLPPPPSPIALDASAALSAAVSPVDRVREHLAQVRHELHRLGPGARKEQLRARVEELKSHLEEVEAAERARASLGSAGIDDWEGGGGGGVAMGAGGGGGGGGGEGGGDFVESVRPSRSVAGLGLAASISAAIFLPPKLSSSSLAGLHSPRGDERRVSEGRSESDSGDDDYDPENAQLAFEQLMFSARRIDGYVAALGVRVEALGGRCGPAGLRALQAEVKALKYLSMARAVLVCHAVRVMETACAMLALGAMDGSRLSAGNFDLQELRVRLRIYQYARFRYADMAAAAASAVEGMDGNPFKLFVGACMHPEIQRDAAVIKRIAVRCEAVKVERKEAEKLLKSILRIESALEEHRQALAMAEAVGSLLWLIRETRHPGFRRERVALAAACDEARDVAAKELEGEERRSIVEKAALLEASRVPERSAHLGMDYLRLTLTLGRRKCAEARFSLVSEALQQLLVDFEVFPGSPYDGVVDAVAERLAALVLAVCSSDAAPSELVIRKEEVTPFIYESPQDEKAALLKGVLASDLDGALNPSGMDAKCEVMSGLRFVFGGGPLGLSGVTEERKVIFADLRAEMIRVDASRARLGVGDEHAGDPGLLGASGRAELPSQAHSSTLPTRSESSFPAVAASLSSETSPLSKETVPPTPTPAPVAPARCFICMAEVASVRMPCCGAQLCNGCGSGSVSVLGRCPKCSSACTTSQLIPI